MGRIIGRIYRINSSYNIPPPLFLKRNYHQDDIKIISQFYALFLHNIHYLCIIMQFIVPHHLDFYPDFSNKKSPRGLVAGTWRYKYMKTVVEVKEVRLRAKTHEIQNDFGMTYDNQRSNIYD